VAEALAELVGIMLLDHFIEGAAREPLQNLLKSRYPKHGCRFGF
jgi:hypothetical protein